MKHIFLIGVLNLIIFLTSCNDTTIEDLDVAQGKIAGQDWEYKDGNAYLNINEIQVILMGRESSNPCGILNPSSPYVKFTIPAQTGTYSIPFGTADKSVKFFEGNASLKNLTSTSGFVQIIGINGFAVEGLIQASFDDDNDVAGAFFATSCN